MDTRSQTIALDIAALARARNPLLWVVTREEGRAEKYLFEAAAAAGYIAETWDVAQGFADMNGRVTNAYNEPDQALQYIESFSRGEYGNSRRAWIMRDLGPWLAAPIGIATQRRLRNLARRLPSVPRERAQIIIVLSAGGDIPNELQGHATVVDWPLPDRVEVADILDAAIKALPEAIRKDACNNGTRDAAIDAAVGLTGEEAAACFARSLVQHKKIDPATIAKEKKRVIAKDRLLEWYDPIAGGLDAVGGLANLKAWLRDRAVAYSPKAREYGLPAPKGCLLVGVPGCGKTLTAKAIATAWGIPLLRLDLNALKSKYVGESEGNLRKALKVIEAIGRCVVWLDEVEKALQGATSGSADGGVSTDALGTILSWMQERQGEAFVIATANDVTSLPPELLRKGRFDEVWFIDLPSHSERVAVLETALRAHKRDPKAIDLNLEQVAKETEGFTGSEIAQLVPEAMFVAFSDKAREIGTTDLLAAASTVTPLSKTADKRIEALRAWGKDRARMASVVEPSSKPVIPAAPMGGVTLDF